jgi:hypothetical protein
MSRAVEKFEAGAVVQAHAASARTDDVKREIFVFSGLKSCTPYDFADYTRITF